MLARLATVKNLAYGRAGSAVRRHLDDADEARLRAADAKRRRKAADRRRAADPDYQQRREEREAAEVSAMTPEEAKAVRDDRAERVLHFRKEARRLLRTVWPEGVPGLAETERQITARLACSPFIGAVRAANPPGAPYLGGRCAPNSPAHTALYALNWR